MRLPRLVAAILLAIGCLAATGSAASASTQVAYNNFNTVPSTVNGKPNEDTYSLDYENFAFGGQVALAQTGIAKGLKAQLDVFACEHGVYSLENCYTLKPNKKFSMAWTAKIYSVGACNAVGTLLSSATATFKLKYRPTTNVSCPATSEGKGFGENCDVGGQLATVTFKHFSPAVALPSNVIILLENACGGCEGKPVNVGVQTSFKEFSAGNFVEEPPANGGVPAVGTDPTPNGAYDKGLFEASGWTNFQPVFELTVAGH
ncbi:MAG: hypothetical protein ACLQBB_04645 [Solirubrobacteraceae bacterium]